MSSNDQPETAALVSSERRIALVIGNGRYTHANVLTNPTNDASALADVLARLGFDVVKGLDLDLRSMGDVQAEFDAKLRANPDVALLFYAGHGLQVRGKNYLIPVDAAITELAHLSSRTLRFTDVLDPMAESAGASLIFLDACRDNPFSRNLARTLGEATRSGSIRGGLAEVEKVAGTFIAYATAPDTLAYDGKGTNSPFTSALLRHIETPALSVGDMMIDVRNSVLSETGGRQEPWDQSSLRSRFYFIQKKDEASPPQKGAAEEWSAIQHTSSLAVLANFRERYSEPPWSIFADVRSEEIRRQDQERRKFAEPRMVAESVPLEWRWPNSLPIPKRRWVFRRGDLFLIAVIVGAMLSVTFLLFGFIVSRTQPRFPVKLSCAAHAVSTFAWSRLVTKLHDVPAKSSKSENAGDRRAALAKDGVEGLA